MPGPPLVERATISPPAQPLRVLDPAALGRLLTLLRDEEGYTLVGPTVRGGAIVHEAIHGLDDLPRGVGDEQGPGRYRLRQRDDDLIFGWASPAQSFKRDVLPPRLDLVQIRRTGSTLTVTDARPAQPRLALIGARPCEVAALRVTDRALAADGDYAARRTASFVLAVHCGSPSGTCFCASMGTGPRAAQGFDLAATELDDPHRFVVEAGSESGAALLARLDAPVASEEDGRAAEEVTRLAAQRMGRRLDTRDLAVRLAARLEHPRWDDVAARCLGCASCTLVCPTCFCTTVAESSTLDGEVASRARTWDSCFTPDFAYVHGGSVRPSVRARYRQWLTHKLSSWVEQFGELGCVGCGRCITWCPVGIDITVWAAAMAEGA